MNLFVRAMFLGGFISIPVSPIGMICLEKIFIQGKKRGLYFILGIITTDIIYFSLSLFFMSKINQYILPYNNIIAFIMGILLISFGYMKFISPVTKIDPQKNDVTFLQNYFKGMTFAFFNIIGIFTICAFLALLNIVPDRIQIYPYVLFAYLIGELIIWNLVIYIVSKLKNYIKRKHFSQISQYSGLIIMFFGAFLSLKILYPHFIYYIFT